MIPSEYETDLYFRAPELDKALAANPVIWSLPVGSITLGGMTVPTHAKFILCAVHEPRPPDCPNHEEIQHRDRHVPWCDSCGWSHGQATVPAYQVKEIVSR